MMLGDLRVDEFAAMGSQTSQCASLILSHEAAVTDDIGGEYGREPTFDPLSVQNLLSR